jgi:hypothetical protein
VRRSPPLSFLSLKCDGDRRFLSFFVWVRQKRRREKEKESGGARRTPKEKTANGLALRRPPG